MFECTLYINIVNYLIFSKVKEFTCGGPVECKTLPLMTKSVVWIVQIQMHGESNLTRHVFVKHGCPRRQQSQNMEKNL